MCLIKIQNGQITGWILGTDVHDLRRKAPDEATAAMLYRMEFPPTGKHDLGDGYFLLVQ